MSKITKKTVSEISFQNDSVVGWSPITFSIEFVTRLRKIPNISHVPSIRTTLAIPKFLSARYFRMNTLSPRDYIEAAVFNTPYEDQDIAERIAHEILFPRAKKGTKSRKRRNQPQKRIQPGPPQQQTQPQIKSQQQQQSVDPTQMILNDLA
ncbi:MAG: hypothetical protein ACFFB5_22595 [Promethearchaeota archaeon]